MKEYEDIREFQFPSNGKDFPNRETTPVSLMRQWQFQFPSNGKDFPNRRRLGKSSFFCCFNSLQTGRTFRTQRGTRINTAYITFQFPSNGKDFPNRTHATIWGTRHQSFNSLQTGRTFRTRFRKILLHILLIVSIPFKREGLSEQNL